MANAGTVNVNLVANTSEFVGGMEKANKMLSKFGFQSSETVKDISKIKQSIEGFLTIVKGFVGFEIAGNVVKSIMAAQAATLELAKAGAVVADEMERQAKNIGVTSNAMASLTVFESRADMAAGSLTSAIGKLQLSIRESIKAGSDADKALASLGLSFKDLIGIPSDQALIKVSQALMLVKDASERAEIGTALFGKTFLESASALSSGKKAFDDAAKSAADLGLALDAVSKSRMEIVDQIKKELELTKKATDQTIAVANAGSLAWGDVSKIVEAKLNAQEEAHRASQRKIITGWQRFGAVWSDFWVRTDVHGKGATPYQDALRSLENQFKETEKAAKSAAPAVASALSAHSPVDNAALNKANKERQAEANKYYHKMAQDMEAATGKIEREERMKSWKSWMFFFNEIESRDKEFGKKSKESGFNFIRGKYESEVKRIDEMRKASASENPLIKDMITSNDIGNSGLDPAQRERLQQIALRRKMLEEEMLGAPDEDVKLIYDEKVELLREELEMKQADDRKKRLENELNVQRAAYSEFFGNLSTIAGAFADQSVEMFMISKVASIAQAEINAWMAYSNILANESLRTGYISAEIMAGMALAAGQVAVMNIAKQQPPGRANGGAVARHSLYEVAEKGPEILESGGRSYLLNGDQSGRVQPLGAGGSPRVTVNVNNLPGQTAQVTQGGSQESPTITIDIVDSMVAASVSNSRSQTSRAMQLRYGLNAARGAQ